MHNNIIDNLYNTGRIDQPGMVRINACILYACIIHNIHRKKKFFISNIIALSVNMYLQRLYCILVIQYSLNILPDLLDWLKLPR